jgi:hypothetical protein
LAFQAAKDDDDFADLMKKIFMKKMMKKFLEKKSADKSAVDAEGEKEENDGIVIYSKALRSVNSSR